MSEVANEQIAIDAPEDVEGHNARWSAVPEKTDDVEGHSAHGGFAGDSDVDPKADGTDGHGAHHMTAGDDDAEGHTFRGV